LTGVYCHVICSCLVASLLVESVLPAHCPLNFVHFGCPNSFCSSAITMGGEHISQFTHPSYDDGKHLKTTHKTTFQAIINKQI